MKKMQNGRHDHDTLSEQSYQYPTGNRGQENRENYRRGNEQDYGNYGSEYDDRSEGRQTGSRNRSDWQNEGYNEENRGSGNNRQNSGNQNRYGRDNEYNDNQNRGGQQDWSGGNQRNYGQDNWQDSQSQYGNQNRYGSQQNEYGNRGGSNQWNQQGQQGQGQWNQQGQSGGSSMRSDNQWNQPGQQSPYGPNHWERQGQGLNQSQYGNTGGYWGSGNSQGQSSGMGNMGGAHKGKGPKGYQRSDDRIKDDVNDRLTDDGHLDASEIQVEVKGGEITLSGTVNSREEKRHAEDITERISGVKNVENRIRVSEGGSDKQSGRENTANSNSATSSSQKQSKTL